MPVLLLSRALVAAVTTLLLVVPGLAGAADQPLQILATTFPLHQIVRNLIQGIPGVEAELMIPAEMGCPHDYALTPRDMRKLGRANVLVINGLGMEEFLGAPLAKANPALKIIDSSRGVGPILPYTAMEAGSGGKEHPDGDHEMDHHAAGPHQDQSGGEHGEDHHHDHGPNPHLFASPRMAALLTASIARQLAEIAPAIAAPCLANAQAYSQRLNQLADGMAALGAQLVNPRIVTQHGVFDYLARDMGLQVVAVVQAHAGQNPSAAEILRLVAAIKAKKAGALFTEPQYPEAVGATIAKEAGIAAARLDPVANGPVQAPLTYYEQVMRTNMQTLEQTLGRH